MLTRQEEEVAGILARQEINEKDMQQRRVLAEQERELAEQERFTDECTKRYQEEGAASYYEARLQVIRRLQERAWPKTETTAGKGSATRFPKEVVPKDVAPSETTSSGGTGKLHLPPKPKKDPGVDPEDFIWKQGYAASSESSRTSTSRPVTTTEVEDFPEDETPEQSKVRLDRWLAKRIGPGIIETADKHREILMHRQRCVLATRGVIAHSR